MQRMPRRGEWLLAALATAMGLLVMAPVAARAAFPFQPCYRGAPVQCAIVDVPIDRSGRVAGTVPLHVVRVPAARPPPPGQPRSAVVGLGGGPGQAALPLLEDFYLTIAPALRTRDLIVFDQRGTGLSGVLRCPPIEHLPTGRLGTAVQACASLLGSARSFYTTLDSADDIEAIRRAAGVDKLMLYGTSYGTKVALAYAQRYPQQTERMVLDSLVDLDGPDPLSRDTFTAIPRVLRDLCADRACQGITTDPVADLAALVKRLAVAPLAGYIVRGDGKRSQRRIGRSSLVDILVEGDFDPALRAAFPAAARAALAGDAAPMMRLARTAMVHEYFPPDPPRSFSNALFLATTCEDGPLPWSPTLTTIDRWRTVFAAAAHTADSVFGPFDRATARAGDTVRMCAPWPASGRPVASPSGAALPDVPTLILGGAADLRTPIENDVALAARLPHASVVTVPRTGHSVIDSDLSGCADAALRNFFADKPVAPTCSRKSQTLGRLLSSVLFPPTPVPPRSLDDLGTPRRLPGRPGRTVRAVEVTFFDSILSLLSTTLEASTTPRVLRIGGLRAGRLIARTRPKVSLRLDRYSYVPGVAVSAQLGNLSRRTLHLRVGGPKAARGHLTFDIKHDLIRGRLGGRRVHLGLTDDIGKAIGGLYQLRRVLRERGPALGRCCIASEVLGRR